MIPFQALIAISLVVPIAASFFMIPDVDGSKPGPLRSQSWLFGSFLWFTAFAVSAVQPDRWGWAVAWGSIALFVLVIASWVGFYRAGAKK